MPTPVTAPYKLRQRLLDLQLRLARPPEVPLALPLPDRLGSFMWAFLKRRGARLVAKK